VLCVQHHQHLPQPQAACSTLSMHQDREHTTPAAVLERTAMLALASCSQPVAVSPPQAFLSAEAAKSFTEVPLTDPFLGVPLPVYCWEHSPTCSTRAWVRKGSHPDSSLACHVWVAAGVEECESLIFWVSGPCDILFSISPRAGLFHWVIGKYLSVSYYEPFGIIVKLAALALLCLDQGIIWLILMFFLTLPQEGGNLDSII